MRAGELIAGRYRLTEQLGSGAHGVVWRALDEQLQRVVALKRAIPSNGGVRELRREARLLARLNHPNVVTLHDVLTEQGECWLVMEYLPARSLADRVPIDPAQAARLGVQLADALAAVHATGILHRDLKPGNVMLVSEEQAKLADFGLSRVVTGEQTLSGDALLTGTPGYVAPEVANGRQPSTASDVFSLGATLFAAVEGESPVGNSDEPVVLRLRRAADGLIASSERGGPLTPVLNRLLQVDPVQRPSAAEARELLAEIAQPAPAPVPIGSSAHPPSRWALLRQALHPHRLPPPPRAPRRRRSWPLPVGAGAVVLVAGLVAWLALDPDPAPNTASSPPNTALPPARTGPLLGDDPRTADPCPLLPPTKDLEPYGKPNLVRDVDTFDRCDMFLKSGGGEIDLQVYLAVTPQTTPGAPPGENHGGYVLVRADVGERYCRNRLLLPDRFEIVVAARVNRHPAFDQACPPVETATKYAGEVINRGESLRRRAQPDPRSWIGKDACALPGRAALRSLPPGIDLDQPVAAFGRWTCTWTGADGTSLKLEFVRRSLLDEAKTKNRQRREIAGRSAVIGPKENDSSICEADVANYHYTDDYGRQREEALHAWVSGPGAMDRKCALATELATAFFPPG